ncbi:MAG: hypothetical protein OXE76_03725, partial [Alphaproteobacteria bacterium]|nr:hypothetical protein [Alphaproteobacteria bacterium]
SELPRALRDLSFGVRLVRLARPHTLVLFASNKNHWLQLMKALDRPLQPTWCQYLGAKFTFRESIAVTDTAPRCVFALPGVNQRKWGRNREVMDILKRRVLEFGSVSAR